MFLRNNARLKTTSWAVLVSMIVVSSGACDEKEGAPGDNFSNAAEPCQLNEPMPRLAYVDLRPFAEHEDDLPPNYNPAQRAVDGLIDVWPGLSISDLLLEDYIQGGSLRPPLVNNWIDATRPPTSSPSLSQEFNSCEAAQIDYIVAWMGLVSTTMMSLAIPVRALGWNRAKDLFTSADWEDVKRVFEGADAALLEIQDNLAQRRWENVMLGLINMFANAFNSSTFTHTVVKLFVGNFKGHVGKAIKAGAMLVSFIAELAFPELVAVKLLAGAIYIGDGIDTVIHARREKRRACGDPDDGRDRVGLPRPEEVPLSMSFVGNPHNPGSVPYLTLPDGSLCTLLSKDSASYENTLKGLCQNRQAIEGFSKEIAHPGVGVPLCGSPDTIVKGEESGWMKVKTIKIDGRSNCGTDYYNDEIVKFVKNESGQLKDVAIRPEYQHGKAIKFGTKRVRWKKRGRYLWRVGYVGPDGAPKFAGGIRGETEDPTAAFDNELNKLIPIGTYDDGQSFRFLFHDGNCGDNGSDLTFTVYERLVGEIQNPAPTDGPPETFNLSATENCMAYVQKNVTEDGMYSITPTGGAISAWGNNSGNGGKSWYWHMDVAVRGSVNENFEYVPSGKRAVFFSSSQEAERHAIGSSARAWEANLKKGDKMYFWVRDKPEGCGDNRGSLQFTVQKITHPEGPGAPAF